jgi:hypothetical protein
MSGDKYGLENPRYTAARTPKIHFVHAVDIYSRKSVEYTELCGRLSFFNSNSSRPRKTPDDDG